MNKVTILNGTPVYRGVAWRAGFWAGLLFLTAMLSFGSASAQYCASNATSTLDSRIASVSIGTSSVASPVGTGNCATYTDYSGGTPFQVYLGSTTTFEVVYGTCGSNFPAYAKLWIDMDGDATFSTSELIGEGSISLNNNLTGSFIIPVGSAITGNVRMRVVMVESGNSSLTTPCGTYTYGETQDFTVNLQAASYCGSNATSTADSKIASVSIGATTVTSPVGTGNCATYTDYSAGTAFQVNAGAPTSFEVVYGTCNGNYNSYAKIWIDLNNDFNFDANEMLGEGSITATGSLTGTFMVPVSGTTVGNVRMRVVLRESGTSANTEACGTYTYGETQDFTVNLQPATGCLAVFNPVATVVNDTTASLAWTEQGSASEWHVEYGIAGFAPGTGAVFNTTTNPHIVNSLMPGTTYDWYVSAVCAGLLSPASAGASFTTQCSSQLAGSYTIDANATPSATTFTSFSAFADQLNLCGIAAPVTVTVAPNSGPYEEQVTLGNIAGSSATNTITIFGNNNEIRYLSTNTDERATLKLNGTAYIFVNDLKVVAQGSLNGEFGFALQIMGGAHHVTVDNCDIQATQGTFSTNFIAVAVTSNSTSASTANYAADNLTISNSSISGGYYGILVNGPSAAPFPEQINILNNEIKDFYLFGLYLRSNTNSTISGNDIHKLNRTNYSTYYGIFLTGDFSGTTIEKNRIHDPLPVNVINSSVFYGMFFSTAYGSASTPLNITNNAIYNVSSNGSQYGIYFSGQSGDINIYHNTISMDNASHSGSSTIANVYAAGSYFNLSLFNNVYHINNGSGGNQYHYFSQAAGSAPLSNNNLFWNESVNGTRILARLQGQDYSTLGAWQSHGNSFDMNSVSANPLFVNAAMGDLSPQSGQADNIGTPLGVLTDILGNARSANTPDAGAFEFTAASCLPPTTVTILIGGPTMVGLDWVPAGAETEWQFVIDSMGTGDLSNAYVANASNVIFNSLSAGTSYDVYLRSICGTGDTSIWFGPITFTTPLCDTLNQCQLQIDLSDTYGDGWNGNVLGIVQNGVVVGTFGSGFNTGSSFGPIFIDVCENTPAEVVVINRGSFTEEVGFTITGPYGTLYQHQPAAFTDSTVFAMLPNACQVLSSTSFSLLTPADGSSITVNAGSPLNLDASWTPMAPVAQYTWMIDAMAGDFSAPLATVIANQNGFDTTVTIPYDAIDGLLAINGVQVGDSIMLKWTVVGINGTDTFFANMPFAIQIARAPGVIVYCPSNATSLGDTKIDSVVIGSFEIGSAQTQCETYTDHTGLGSVASVDLGQSLNIAIKTGYCGSQAYNARGRAFIDFNHDGDFTADEAVLDFGPMTNTGSGAQRLWFGGSAYIPNHAQLGVTRLRIVYREGAASFENVFGCGTYSWGETEDFEIEITQPALTTVQLILPNDGEMRRIAGNPQAIIQADWTPAIAANGDPITYHFEMEENPSGFGSADLSLLAADNGTSNYIRISYATLDSFMASQGVAIGDTVQYHWSVKSTAGGLTTYAFLAHELILIRGGFAPLQVVYAPQGNGASTGVRGPNGTLAHAYQRSVMHVDAQEFLDAGLNPGDEVYSMQFNFTGGTDTAAHGFMNVFLQLTNDSILSKSRDWSAITSDMFIIYSDFVQLPVGPGPGSMTLNFPMPFTWDGSSMYVGYDYEAFSTSSTAAIYVANNARPSSLFSANSQFNAPDTLFGTTSFRPEIGWGKLRTQFDLSLENAYVMERNLQNNGPEQVYVAIRNNGSMQDPAATLSLNAWGPNAQQTTYGIPSIPPDSTVIVALQPLSTNDFGFSGIDFQLSPDENTMNDFLYRERDVNPLYQALAVGVNHTLVTSVGFGASEGISYIRYELGTARSVQAAHAVIGAAQSNVGETVYMVIATDSGILGTSLPYTITQADLGLAKRFEFSMPIPLNAGAYYVGLAQPTSATANAYFPIAVRQELPARPNAYYYSNLAGVGIVPDNFLISNGLVPIYETEFVSNTPPQANFFASEHVAYMGGRNTSIFLQDISGGNPTSFTWQIQHVDSNVSTGAAVNVLSGGFGQPQLEVSFNQPGFYSVSLTVSNALGGSNSTRSAYLFVMEDMCESWANSIADTKIDSFAFAGIMTGSDPQTCERVTSYSGQNPLLGGFPQHGRGVLSSVFNNQYKKHVFGGNRTQSGWGSSYDDLPLVTAPLVVYQDDTSGFNHLACASPAVNAADLAGKVVLIWRGTCEFSLKALHAQQAGAVGVIIVNNMDGAPINIGGGSNGQLVTIPVAFVTDQAGWYLYNEITNGSLGSVTMGGVAPQHIGQLFVGQQETIAIKPGSCGGFFNAAGKVFIDFNGNSIFDQDEEVFSFVNAPGYPWVQGTVTVPPTAVAGLQRMRVVLNEGATLANMSACGTYSWGETEDYLVEISGNFPGLTASLPDVDVCSGMNSIPVTVSNFVNVGAISMTIFYDQQNMSFSGISQVNPALAGGQVLANAVNGQLGISWYDVNGATSMNDTLFYLDFNVSGPSLLEWDMSPGANELADAQGNVLMSLFLDGEVNITNQCNEILGVLTYDNNSATPLNNSTVILLSGGNVVQTAVTDASGAFSLSGFPNGVYELTAVTGKAWGGVNATDALGIARHFTGAVLLSGIRQAAADVNGSNSINSTDALFVARRFTGQISGFNVGDWVFSNPTVQVNGQPLVQDIKGLAYGDVNGSYIPSGARVMPQIFVDHQGSLLVGSEEIKVPVRIDRSLDAGAISLILQAPYGVQVNRVESTLPGGEFTYEVLNGEIRISWFTLDEVALTEDDIIFNLYMNAPTAEVMGDWAVAGLSEVANGWAEVYPTAGVRLPSVQGLAGGPFDAEVYPNPTADLTNLRIRIPESGKVTVRIVDGLGKTVHLEHGMQLEQGTTLLELDAAKWSAGRYHATILYELDGKLEMKQLKIQVIR